MNCKIKLTEAHNHVLSRWEHRASLWWKDSFISCKFYKVDIAVGCIKKSQAPDGMMLKVLETRKSEIGLNCKEFYDEKKKMTQLRWYPKAIKHCFVWKMYRFSEKPEDGAGSLGVDGTGLGGGNRTWVLCKSKCCSPLSCLLPSPHTWIYARKEKGKGKKLNRKTIAC